MTQRGEDNPAGPSGPVRRTDVLPEQTQARQRNQNNPVDRVSESSTSENAEREPILSRRAQHSSNESSSAQDTELKYGAEAVINLFIPVTACMIFVIASVQCLSSYSGQQKQTVSFIYTPFHPADDDSAGTIIWQTVANSLIMISVIAVMTFVLVLLYKYECNMLLGGWLIFSTMTLIFMFGYFYLQQILKVNNAALDWVTLGIVMWNFGIVGIICIHWKGPLFLQQCYLIISAALMALIFIKMLPNWTTWLILAFLSIWDLIAVLCPYGPLNMLLQLANDREDELFPALIYSSGAGVAVPTVMVTTSAGTFLAPLLGMAETSDSSPQEEVQVRQPRSLRSSERTRPDERREGVKLGLGDFIFYSVLVGKASQLHDWNITLACILSILVGLSTTLIILAFFKKPLPALPISLTLGLIFYFTTTYVIAPFMDLCIMKQVFL